MKSDTDRWLEAQFAGCDGWVEVNVKQRNGRMMAAHYPRHEITEGHMLEAAERGLDVYLGCTTIREENVPDSGRGKAGVRYELPGCWLDLDIGTEGHRPRADGLRRFDDENEAMLTVARAGMPQPTAVIHSGGGLYTWWLFDKPLVIDEDPLDRATAEMILTGVNTLVATKAEEMDCGIDKLDDVARILRPPGTVNMKTEKARRVVLLDLDPGRRYTPDELGTVMEGVDPGAVSAVRSSGGRRSAPQEGSLADAVRAATWEEILGPVGWTRGDNSTDVEEAWLRPEKDSRDDGGRSAVVYEDAPDVLVVFSDATGLPSGSKRGLTKFRVMAWLHFGGNESRAARNLANVVKTGNRGVWPQSVIDAARAGSGMNLRFVQERVSV